MREPYHKQCLWLLIFVGACILLLLSLNQPETAFHQKHSEALGNPAAGVLAGEQLNNTVNRGTKDATTLGGASYNETIDDMQILIWTPLVSPNEENLWDGIFQRLISKQCAENRCRLLYNKTNYKAADAVLFSLHFMNPNFNYQVPQTHPVDQLWVVLSFESNYSFVNRKYQAQMLSRLGFNWTMHFRQDSDVFMPYGVISQIEDPINAMVNSRSDYWSRKDRDKLAAWMVSHCRTDSARESYVKELQKHIRVDIYGGCGNLTCGTAQYQARKDQWKLKECTDVTNEYFFYLAFENSICRDYVTEKFFRSLGQDVVPVVMGGADYALIAPPHSYIDALDFTSPKDLADFLKNVASNPSLYNRYFEWKPYYTVDIGHPYSPMVCGLCEKLHQHRTSKPLVATKLNLSDWFDNDGCQGSWKQVIMNKLTND